MLRVCWLRLQGLFAQDKLDIECEETGGWGGAVGLPAPGGRRCTARHISPLKPAVCPAVFCAFAHWMDAQAGLTPWERRAIAARILPLVRFSTMRPATVATYWHAFDWFRCVDGSHAHAVRF